MQGLCNHSKRASLFGSMAPMSASGAMGTAMATAAAMTVFGEIDGVGDDPIRPGRGGS